MAPTRDVKWWALPLVLPAVAILLAIAVPIAALGLIFYGLKSLILHLAILTWWCGRGREVLFVYSHSPEWHEHIERTYFPVLGRRAIVLNWSERSRWGLSLARLAFEHFGGRREFNPMAVVFRPFRRTRVFRFYRAFLDRKHGKLETLRQVEHDFFAAIAKEDSLE